MLLGSDTQVNNRHVESQIDFIRQLISQLRFSEAYQLLKKEAADNTVTQYNLALCLYWAGNFREALTCLDKAQLFMPAGAGKTNPLTDSFYKAIREKQNHINDHHTAINQKNVQLTPHTVADGIIRLKIDCWLRLGEYAKVIDIASPIAYKNYLNVAEALFTAKKHLEK